MFDTTRRDRPFDEVVRGGVMDIQKRSQDSRDVGRAASNFDKYATNITDRPSDWAHWVRSRRQIEPFVCDSCTCRLVRCARDLDPRPEYSRLHLRDHAHIFGVPGQWISKSREHSTTYSALRSIRGDFTARRNVADSGDGTFRDDGRGDDNPWVIQLAGVLFTIPKFFFAPLRTKFPEHGYKFATSQPTCPDSGDCRFIRWTKLEVKHAVQEKSI